MYKQSLLFIVYSLVTAGLIITANACVPVFTSPPPSPVPPSNNIPQISQVIAPGVITALAPAEITCKATDTDGDLLAYNWIASSGNITGSGAIIIWIAPPVAGRCSLTG